MIPHNVKKYSVCSVACEIFSPIFGVGGSYDKVTIDDIMQKFQILSENQKLKNKCKMNYHYLT